MRYPGYPAGLRITVGTDDEIDRLLEILRGFALNEDPRASV